MAAHNHHITSHHITSHHITSHHITSHHPIVSWLKRCLRKILWFDVNFRHRKFVFRMFGKNVVSCVRYIIVSFCTNNYNSIEVPAINVIMRRITAENARDFLVDDFPYKDIAESLKNNVEWFGLWTGDGDPVCSVSLRYRGGSSLCFRLKTLEAYIGGVFTFERFRRKGCCEYLISEVLKYLSERKNISVACLAVRSENYPARCLYRKLGGKDDSAKQMLRVLRKNFLTYDL